MIASMLNAPGQFDPVPGQPGYAPLVARWHKQFIQRLMEPTGPTPLSEAEHEQDFACFGTEDFRTGYQAFLEKVKPNFKGR